MRQSLPGFASWRSLWRGCNGGMRRRKKATAETKALTFLRNMGTVVLDHQEVQEQLEQFEKKLEQSEDQLEEHAKVEKVTETDCWWWPRSSCCC